MHHKIKYQNPDQLPLQHMRVFDAPLYEKSLLDTWLNVHPGTIFNDLDGHSVMVIKPGIPNQNEGPDIREAVIFTRGKFLAGDIECHIRSRDWFYHGHPTDPNYHNIILHITAIPDNADGELGGRQIHLYPQRTTNSCDLHQANVSQFIEKSIVQFGLDRRSGQMNRYKTSDWKKCVLTDIFRLMGKGGNEGNFIQLLGLFQQGFKPDDPTLQRIRWHHRGIRPGGWPEKRIIIAHHLFGVVSNFTERPNQIISTLKPLMSKNLYVELVGNVLNPLAALACLERGEYESYKWFNQEWLNLKLGYSYGRFEKQFNNVLTPSQLKSFSILQGLLELENGFCKAYHCSVCPLKKKYGHFDPS